MPQTSHNSLDQTNLNQLIGSIAIKEFPLDQRSERVSNDPLEWLLQKAEETFQRNETDQSIPMFQKAIYLARGNKNVLIYCYLRLAEINSQRREFTKFRRNFLKAVFLDPDNAELRFLLGESMLQLEKPREAMVAFHAAIQRDPDNSQYRTRLAACLGKLGRFREANRVFKDGLSRNPSDVKLLLSFSQYFMDCNEFKSAERILKKGLDLVPDDKDISKAYSLLQFLKKGSSPPEQRTKTKTKSKTQEKLQQKSTRVDQDGFHYVFREDTHWIDDGDRLEEYNDYRLKDPEHSVQYKEWLELEDERIQFLYWSSLRDLDFAERARLKHLDELLSTS